jgi:hypothetical protein
MTDNVKNKLEKMDIKKCKIILASFVILLIPNPMQINVFFREML